MTHDATPAGGPWAFLQDAHDHHADVIDMHHLEAVVEEALDAWKHLDLDAHDSGVGCGHLDRQTFIEWIAAHLWADLAAMREGPHDGNPAGPYLTLSGCPDPGTSENSLGLDEPPIRREPNP